MQISRSKSDSDPLTEALRNGARSLLAQAVEAEVAAFLAKHTDLKTEDGRSRIVRHGHLPEREVMTGIGPVGVRQPRVRADSLTSSNPSKSWRYAKAAASALGTRATVFVALALRDGTPAATRTGRVTN